MMILDYKGGKGFKNLGKSYYVICECSRRHVNFRLRLFQCLLDPFLVYLSKSWKNPVFLVIICTKLLAFTMMVSAWNILGCFLSLLEYILQIVGNHLIFSFNFLCNALILWNIKGTLMQIWKSKIIPWKFRNLSPKNSRVIHP